MPDQSIKAPLNKGIIALLIGAGLLLWVARALNAFGMLRTPFGVILNEANNGENLTSKVGSVITITLHENPSVGTWRISPANDPLFNQPTTSSGIKVGTRYDIRKSRSWKLTPEMVGTHRIQLDYQKGSETPTKTFSFVVTVV